MVVLTIMTSTWGVIIVTLNPQRCEALKSSRKLEFIHGIYLPYSNYENLLSGIVINKREACPVLYSKQYNP